MLVFQTTEIILDRVFPFLMGYCHKNFSFIDLQNHNSVIRFKHKRID